MITFNKTHKFYFYITFIFLFLFISCKYHHGNNTKKKEHIKNSTKKNVDSKTSVEKENLNLSELSLKTGISMTGNENVLLYQTISEWLGTPYKYGGKDKNGIDCSGFVIIVYTKVYNYNLNNSSFKMLNDTKAIEKSNLQEGDLVFFKTYKDEVSHVGIYLKDNKFVHASSSKGVLISDLNEDYWLKTYYIAGRVNLK